MSTTEKPAAAPVLPPAVRLFPIGDGNHVLEATIGGVEWRDSGNGTDFTLTGHAAVFDAWSDELHTLEGTFRERIAPGAFRDVLEGGADVRALFNHDTNFVLGRTKAGTLALAEDDQGLRVWARVARTNWARDLRASMQRGDIDQMSFAFTVAEDEWDMDGDAIERTILRVGDLYDVSVVTHPAYPQTDAALRELRAAHVRGAIALPTVAPDEPADTPPAAPDNPAGEPSTSPEASGVQVARLKTRARMALINLEKKDD